ncbi:HNH endonuclease signature motif containing protein [Neomicrococcus lactis]|uniref:HNH endonuclease signature motif containing protein n=1 Tax=Neomicrococcus lactis TaxID=732241 RepID=UPI00230123E4|nr:HNH endonuclease signature motif containing protein [Neomicrococcus lactis]
MTTTPLLQRMLTHSDSLRTEFDSLTDTQLTRLSDDQWADYADAVEAMSRFLTRFQVHAAAAFVRAAQDAQAAGVGTRLRTKTPEERLAERLGVTKSEIRRRVAVADALQSGTDEYGQAVEPKYPAVAELFNSGGTSLSTASTMIRELDKATVLSNATPDLDTARVRRDMEAALVQAQHQGGAPLVTTVGKNWLNRLNTKNVQPTSELAKQFQGLHLIGRKYGLNHGEFYLDDEHWATLVAGSSFEANPRIKTTNGGNGGSGTASETLFDDAVSSQADEDAVAEELKDSRTRPQKLADGLMRTIQAGLSTNKLPWNGGLRPQVMVTIDAETLQGRIANSKTFQSHSAQVGPIDPGLIRRIACNADLLPVVLNGEGRVLDVGAPQRLFTTEQRKILYARDLGCTAPGCTVPADGCEAHHVQEWSKDGPTTIENGVLVCHFHHKLVHDTPWKIDMSRGVPYWIPPKAVDPNQKPRRNYHFHPELVGADSGQSAATGKADDEPRHELN